MHSHNNICKTVQIILRIMQDSWLSKKAEEIPYFEYIMHVQFTSYSFDSGSKISTGTCKISRVILHMRSKGRFYFLMGLQDLTLHRQVIAMIYYKFMFPLKIRIQIL